MRTITLAKNRASSRYIIWLCIFSKFNTVAQIVLVVAVLTEQAAGLDYPFIRQILIFSVLASTIISGSHYFWLWLMKRDIVPIDSNDK